MLSIPENILLFLCGFGMLQGILLAAVLYFHPRADRSVSTFLALYICCISIPLLLPLGQYLTSWQVMLFIEPVTVLIGPLLYLYVRSFREALTWSKIWPHLIIFLPYILIAWWSYVNLGKKYPPTAGLPREVFRHPVTYIPIIIRLLLRLLYYFLSLRVLTSYQRSIRHLFSDISRINLSWVRWLINGNLIILIAIMISYTMMMRNPQHVGIWILFAGCLVTIYIYLAAWQGVSQPTIWQVQPTINKETLESILAEAEPITTEPTERPAGETPKTRKAGLSEARITEITTHIITLMEVDKLYQEPELTLQQLATRLELSVHQLSQAINDGLKKNFYELVNGYRVAEAKRLLQDDKTASYTILSIGYEAGFNSKTTFNTVFKKFTGLTPSDFRQQQNELTLISN